MRLTILAGNLPVDFMRRKYEVEVPELIMGTCKLGQLMSAGPLHFTCIL